jgi:methionine-S-sulfoxide reductase
MLKRLTAISLLGLAGLATGGALPAPVLDLPVATAGTQTAVLAGGCFWGVQGVYQHLKGVRNVLSGYSGGSRATANYDAVSGGDSGHAEAVQIVYDPKQVSYGQILQVFFSVVHDPTQLNRQGPDVGSQYRSAIFYTDENQKKVAEAYIAQLDQASVYPRRIVTQVVPLKAFHKAEAYHQDYMLNHPDQPYIRSHDIPKLKNFQSQFPAWYGSPVTVAANRGVTARQDAPSGKVTSTDAPAGAMSARPAPESAGGAMMSNKNASGTPVIAGDMPELRGATGWLNSQPLTRASLKGKVVVLDFWTYSCINCLRAIPYVNAWYQHYKDSGLVVIGVHSPEFAFEKDRENVRKAVEKFAISYPVAVDSNMALWKSFNNRFWPAHYFVDAQGKIRGHHFGEGKYARSERAIRKLLEEAGATNLPDPLDDAAGQGVSAAADTENVKSPETYLGFERAENFLSPGSFARNAPKDYQLPATLALNQWAFAGRWKAGDEKSALQAAPGRIVFKFRARDLHLVLGTGGKPVRFKVLLDGKVPGADHGMDIDAQGVGTVREQRLYQLIRQKGAVQEHEFSIEFLDPGVEAYSFTFG